MRTLLKRLIPLILFTLLVGCTEKSPDPGKVQVVDDPPVVAWPKIKNIEDIKNYAETSDCRKQSWKDRGIPPWTNNGGKAPKGYVHGMAIMFAKQVCFPSPTVAATKYNSSGRDALQHFRIEPNQLNTFTLLYGLGLRESSGKYCKGRDKSANWKDADSAEAGMFQASYVSRVFNSEILKIYRFYEKNPNRCFLYVFREQAKCDSYDAKNYGRGAGVNYQKLVKRCPALAVDWASVLIRSQHRHFGPLIRREAQFNLACREMFEGLEMAIKADRSVCSQFKSI